MQKTLIFIGRAGPDQPISAIQAPLSGKQK